MATPSALCVVILLPQISAANALRKIMEERLERANAALVRTFQVSPLCKPPCALAYMWPAHD